MAMLHKRDLTRIQIPRMWLELGPMFSVAIGLMLGLVLFLANQASADTHNESPCDLPTSRGEYQVRGVATNPEGKVLYVETLRPG